MAAAAASVDAKAGAARETKVDKDCEPYVLADAPPVSALDVAQAFSKLDAKEKRYAHYMSRAAWFGAEIVLTQTSPESPAVFAILNALFGAVTHDGVAPAGLDAWKAAAASAGANAQEWQWFVQWSASFYTNSGNYLSFGDSKFVPRVAPAGFSAILHAATRPQALANRKTALPAAELTKLSQAVEAFETHWLAAVYSLKPNERGLSFPESGVSTYYSPNVTKADMDAAQKVMNAHGISAYNTRLFKTTGADGKPQLELRLASAVRGPERVVDGLRVTTADHSAELARVVENLKLARPHAANAVQGAMVDAYIAHFNGGDIDLHKASQRAWIQDVGPAVETNIGFIESYRDPFGSRGEFEGFVAVVNKETSKKFGALVDGAPKLLPKLPWPAAFEKDEFKRPDFTALEVITFAGSGIPAGINIPNYDDIRQNEGFKNVSLANVLSAKPPSRPITFLTEPDQAAFKELKGHAFEVQVGCHELLGHGSGKLFCESKDGKLNFDKEKTLNPLTGKPFTVWYKAGQTYDTQFGYFASTMEECRAELVGLLLSADKDVLKVFGYSDEKEAASITYVNWLNMVRAGLLGLEFYTPEKKKWGQAHMQARYGILTTLLAAGNGLVTITETKDAVGAPDLLIQLDRTKIHTVGIPAVNAFLLRIQVYKSSADVDAAKAMYHAATDVSDAMLRLRATVMARKQARPMFVQSHTHLNPQTGEVELQTFPATAEGVVLSFVTRYAPTNY